MLLAGKPAFLIAPIDVNAQAGETAQIVAREASRRLETAMREWEEQRTPRYLAGHRVGGGRDGDIRRALVGRPSRQPLARQAPICVGGVALPEAERRRREPPRFVARAWLTRRALTLVSAVTALALASAWLTAVLELFPYTRPWGEGLNGSLLEISKDFALAVVAALPGLLVVVVIYFIARGVRG